MKIYLIIYRSYILKSKESSKWKIREESSYLICESTTFKFLDIHKVTLLK